MRNLLLMLNLKEYSMDRLQTLFSKLHLYLLIIPIYSRLILPEVLELSLTRNIFGYSLFLPEICFFLLPFVARLRANIFIKNIKLILLTLFGLFLGYLSAINGGSRQVMNNFLAGTDFYASLLVFLFFPLNKENAKYLLKPTLLLVTIISLEIVLYSFGFLSYEKDLSGEHDFSGISRISTTIGSATGTAVAYFLMSVILYNFISEKYKKIFIIITALVGSITLTRSILLANIILLFFVFIQKKEVKNNKKQKIYKTLGALVLFLIIPIALNKIGILDSISSRNESLEYGNRDVSNGRFDRWISGLEFFEESPILGIGANSVTMHKRARYMDVDSKDLFSPHNTFVLILMERGIVGFFVFLVILFQLIRPIRIRGTSIIKLTILIAVFISMNTEIVYVFIEFSGLLFILWNLSLLEKKN